MKQLDKEMSKIYEELRDKELILWFRSLGATEEEIPLCIESYKRKDLEKAALALEKLMYDYYNKMGQTYLPENKSIN